MINNVLKRQTLIITITVITLCIGLLGVSYAVFFSVDDGKNQQVTTGDLVIQFQEDTETITTATVPQTDEEGTNTNGYTFSVTNNGSLPMIYDIYLYDDPEAKSDDVTMIPHEDLRVQLDGGDIHFLSELEEDSNNVVEEDGIRKIKINPKKLSVSAKPKEILHLMLKRIQLRYGYMINLQIPLLEML